MPSSLVFAVIVAGTGAIACGGTAALIPLLRRAAVLDRPNERSSHIDATPRGGGIAVTAAILLAWLALIGAGLVSTGVVAVAVGGTLLAAVSWVDDLRSLSPAVRLGVQAIAVGIGLPVLLPVGPVFQGWLPGSLDAIAAALIWVWFLNLFNFMDGIDGIAGCEAAAIALGLWLLLLAGIGGDTATAALAATAAAAALGFLVWNWAPARIFLGDVGSVPLGYFLGFLLLHSAARGAWLAALILPLYFLADATITLVRRLARGERVWRPHREHFYQRAVQRGLGHAAVVRRVIAADILLIACAWTAENGAGLAGMAAAAAIVAALLANLAGIRRRAAD